MQRRTSVEIQAYSVDEAVRLALDELQLARDQVEVEVLIEASDDPDDEALVRVSAKGEKAPATAPSTATASQAGDRLRGRRSPSDRPSSRGSIPAPVTTERVDAEDETVARQVVRDLLEHMAVEADVVAVDNPSSVPLDPDDPPTIFIDILGNDLGMLIGRRGEHLTHLQYLVNLIVNRRLDEWSRVIIDVEGYRARREDSLIGLAERVARQVGRSGRPVTLEPMPPNERRVIHLTLRAHPDVGTESTGEGNERRITVLPKS